MEHEDQSARIQELEGQVAELRRRNQELGGNEQRLRAAIEMGRIGLWVWDSRDVANPGDWSDRLKEIFGLPAETAVTHDLFLKGVHPEDRDMINQAVMSALAGKNQGRYCAEYRTIRADNGQEGWVIARGQAFFDAEGKTDRFLGTVVDITERRRAEEALACLNAQLEARIAQRTSALESANLELKSSKDYLRTVLDTIPGLVWSALPDGFIDYHNRRWLEYTGMADGEADGWDWQRAVHPDDLPGLLEYWRLIVENGALGEYEARLRRHDGVYRWFLFRAVPLYNSAGALVKWYGTNTDVEDRRTSELLARGQVEALTHTLTAISREPAPEKFLEPILQMIVQQLHAHSLSVWELNELTGQVELLAEHSDDALKLATHSPIQTPQNNLVVTDHPVWTEFFATGEHCVLGQIVDGQPWVRLAGQLQGTLYNYQGQAVSSTEVPPILNRLMKLGVTAMLGVPLLMAGQVVGFISIRFLKERDFGCEEIQLARALAHQAMLAIQLMRLSQESHRSAVVAERNRLAREIHDTLAQGFTGVIVQLEASEDARSHGLSEMADSHLQRAQELAADSLREARRSVRALRPQVLEKQNLCRALSSMITRLLEGTGIQNGFELHGEAFPLPTEVEDNLLRIGQEVLTNALRHAQATVFQVDLTFTEEGVCLDMNDNGRGFDRAQESEGFGLIGIRERVRAMAGTLVLDSKPGQGTRVAIQLPLPHDHVG